jgi:hypothetical protein
MPNAGAVNSLYLNVIAHAEPDSKLEGSLSRPPSRESRIVCGKRPLPDVPQRPRLRKFTDLPIINLDMVDSRLYNDPAS